MNRNRRCVTSSTGCRSPCWPSTGATSGRASSTAGMADLHRFFVPAEALDGDRIEIGGEALHHLRTVLRLGPGSEILLLDGAGNCCRALLETVGRESAVAVATARWRETEALCPLRLLQA